MENEIQVILDTNNKDLIASKTPASLLREHLNEFIETKNAKENTKLVYLRNINKFIDFVISEGVTFQDFTRKTIIKYREHLNESKEATTAKNYLVSLKLYLEWLKNYGIIPPQLIFKDDFQLVVDKEHKHNYLTTTQLAEVLGKLDLNTQQGLRDYAIILLMATCGLRTCEVINANIEDFTVCGNNTVLYVLGKKRKQKTDYVIIPHKLEKIIREYLATRKNKKMSEPLFAGIGNKNKGGRLTTRTISRLAKNNFIKAGINDKRTTAHSLRHTAVTLALANNCKLEDVSIFARHRDIQTTLIYDHSRERENNKCSEVVESIIFNELERNAS